ncbi:MAG TPA: GDP-L-fucose synthase, partial [Lysinibacillus sp.]|nr:GDP-L-fucose synthase [Lysinibacillus sp.]
QPISETELLTNTLEYTNEPYAIAKIAGLKMCESFNIQYGTNFISVMPTNLYGPNDNFDLERSHVLPAMIRKIHLSKHLMNKNWQELRKDLSARPVEGLNGSESEKQIVEMLARYGIFEDRVELWGSGTPMREFLWSEEMADACIFVMNNVEFKDLYTGKEIRNTHINIGTGKDITIGGLSKLIADKILYTGKILFDSSKPDGTFRKLVDVSKLNALGWKHQIEIEEGVNRMYDWYLQNL